MALSDPLHTFYTFCVDLIEDFTVFEWRTSNPVELTAVQCHQNLKFLRSVFFWAAKTKRAVKVHKATS